MPLELQLDQEREVLPVAVVLQDDHVEQALHERLERRQLVLDRPRSLLRLCTLPRECRWLPDLAREHMASPSELEKPEPATLP